LPAVWRGCPTTEVGALSDLRHALDLLAPVEAEYGHNARWGDGNGFSHVRFALLKTSLSVPVLDGELAPGDVAAGGGV
jgi:thiamine phosphate synthase YjbQ (UPF0047 family)